MSTITQNTNPLLSAAERGKAITCLADSRDILLNTLDRVHGPEWAFKPTADRWSILDNLEHMVLVENRLQDILGRMPDGSPVGADDVLQPEAELLAAVQDRTQRFNAPPAVHPTGRWTPSEAMDEFKAVRAKTFQLLDSAILRGRTIPHPFLGPWDGYRWILAISAHTLRHLDQIREVMRDPAFPAHSEAAVPTT